MFRLKGKSQLKHITFLIRLSEPIFVKYIHNSFTVLNIFKLLGLVLLSQALKSFTQMLSKVLKFGTAWPNLNWN